MSMQTADLSQACITQHTGTLQSKLYSFHTVRIHCYTNRVSVFSLLDALFARFPVAMYVEQEIYYYVCCYDDTTQFPYPLPENSNSTDAITLVTKTPLLFFSSPDHTLEYQYYQAQPSVNAPVMSVLSPGERITFTQLLPLEQYDAAFLHRYVFLFALGQLLQHCGFLPYHAAALTAPNDETRGMLLLGASGCGKTTLSLACTLDGCGLLGDDLVLVREEADLLYAYSILPEISVRPKTLELLPALAHLQAYPVDQRNKRYCRIEQLRPGASCLRTPIRLLLFPTLIEHGQTRLLPLRRAATLQTLLEQGISSEQREPHVARERLFAQMALLAEQAIGYRLLVARGDSSASALVGALLMGNA